VSGRLSPTEALCLLMGGGLSAHDAADRLNTGMHTNKCRLWCDGNLLLPDYIATSLIVVAKLEAHGRWRADVVSSTREAWEKPAASYVFEFKADEVKALLPPTPEPQPEPPPAPKPPPKKKVKRARRRRRRKPKPPESEKAKPSEATPPAPKQPTASKSREQAACRQFAVRKYPHGYNSIRTSVIMHDADLDKEFKQTVVPFPKRDVWLRALGRRKS
jgi:hypothetical protein